MLSKFFENLSNWSGGAKAKKQSPQALTPRPTYTPAPSLKRPPSVMISIDEDPIVFSRFTEVISPSQFEHSSEPMLRLVLSNPTLHTLMSEFAKTELSVENIKCWDSIQRYRNAENFEKRAELAHYIFNTFLGSDAITEVNITKTTVKKVWADIEDELYSEWLFDKLEQELEECLENILSRFQKTLEYQQFMDEHKTIPTKKRKKSINKSSPVPVPSSLPMGMGYLDGTQTDRLGLGVSPKKRDYFGLHREV